ncbi:MAG: hypothetical protein CO029_04295 [Candidatus Magasanikbacteria bacterium CG_4_9_14_0_2_um_filter_41_10]|nr:MAG: hypothetical protein AUJ37_03320 [Candidatus Magasanikbacteria bacterium CG1_02_41_34]PJC53132.1 MAG: hypothetical protein CO029_04295 [Candidatus Magasanikbacteria bacterium CG_4_9_14_0_2_um_filter_41_10]
MDVVYIILGWLFGILSPGLVNKIANGYKKKSLKRVIIEELKDTKKRLSSVPIMVYPAYGALNEDHYLWVKEQTNNFTELISDDDRKEKFDELLKQNISDNNVIELFNSTEMKENPAFHFKKIETSIIDSNQINFDILDNQFLIKILEIKFQIRVYNDEIQSVNEYVKMTFDASMTDTNHQIIQEQIKRKNYTIAEKAVLIVNKINQAVQFI